MSSIDCDQSEPSIASSLKAKHLTALATEILDEMSNCHVRRIEAVFSRNDLKYSEDYEFEIDYAWSIGFTVVYADGDVQKVHLARGFCRPSGRRTDHYFDVSADVTRALTHLVRELLLVQFNVDPGVRGVITIDREAWTIVATGEVREWAPMSFSVVPDRPVVVPARPIVAAPKEGQPITPASLPR